MFSVAPNILLAPNMTQNAERKTQDANTAHNRPLRAPVWKKTRSATAAWKHDTVCYCSLDNMKIKKTRCCLNFRNRLILFCNQRELADENYLQEQRVAMVIAFRLLIGSLLSLRN